MLGVVIKRAGGPGVLKMERLPLPNISDGDVLIKVEAVAVNRQELDLRRVGFRGRNDKSYCPGIECSGVILAVGDRVKDKWKIGQKVCAILKGGGYATRVAVPANQLFSVPEFMCLSYAACLPHAACTIWRAFSLGKLRNGKYILIHESCGYYALFAIQLARYMEAGVIVATESDENIGHYKAFGADKCINWNDRNFVAQVREETEGRGGVDTILDSWAVHVDKNLESLCVGGMLIFVDLHGGILQTLDTSLLMAKNAKIQVLDWAGNYDRQVLEKVNREVWPAINDGLVDPAVNKSYPLSQAAEAHRFMESKTFGQKIVSALEPWASRLEPYVYTGMLSKDFLGKIILQCDEDDAESAMLLQRAVGKRKDRKA